eukprot:6172212-Pleurochrysis_carterae.AAC.2
MCVFAFRFPETKSKGYSSTKPNWRQQIRCSCERGLREGLRELREVEDAYVSERASMREIEQRDEGVSVWVGE